MASEGVTTCGANREITPSELLTAALARARDAERSRDKLIAELEEVRVTLAAAIGVSPARKRWTLRRLAKVAQKLLTARGEA